MLKISTGPFGENKNLLSLYKQEDDNTASPLHQNGELESRQGSTTWTPVTGGARKWRPHMAQSSSLQIIATAQRSL